MTTKRVLVAAAYGRFDLTKAEQHGAIEVMLDDTLLNPLSGQPAYNLLVERLEELQYDPKTDTIALTGPIPVVSMLVLAAAEFADTINVLIFDARNGGSYRARTLKLGTDEE